MTDYNSWIAASNPPFFAPNCGQHDSLTSLAYFNHVLEQHNFAGGVIGPIVFDTVTYDEALFRFVAPGQTPEQIYHGLTGLTPAGNSYIWVSPAGC